MGLIAIDPGVHCMAVAMFSTTGTLLDARNEVVTPYDKQHAIASLTDLWHTPSVALVNRIQRNLGATVDTLVGERQVIYPGAKGLKTNPNDLLDVAMCAGSFYGGLLEELRVYRVRLVEPAQWKAQVPKDICRARIEKLLSEEERKSISRGGEMHNVFDAIGIGLFWLGRAGRGMVKP